MVAKVGVLVVRGDSQEIALCVDLRKGQSGTCLNPSRPPSQWGDANLTAWPFRVANAASERG